MGATTKVGPVNPVFTEITRQEFISSPGKRARAQLHEKITLLPRIPPSTLSTFAALFARGRDSELNPGGVQAPKRNFRDGSTRRANFRDLYWKIDERRHNLNILYYNVVVSNLEDGESTYTLLITKKVNHKKNFALEY